MSPLDDEPTAHLMCGLVGAGKTTLARQLESELPGLRFSRLIWKTAIRAMQLGSSVILDWSHWSAEQRADSAARARAAGFDVIVHFVDVPVQTSIERTLARSVTPSDGVHGIGEDGARFFSTIFEPPAPQRAL